MAIQVRKAGALKRGKMVALMGERGSGKTTLAASFPNPVVVAIEDGTQSLARMETPVVDLPPVKGQHYRDLLTSALRDLAGESYRTIILDSATAMLSYMTDDLVRHEPEGKRNLGQAGKGYFTVRDEMVGQVEKLVANCLWMCRERDKHIVWILHQTVKNFPRPDQDDIQRVVGEGEFKSIAAILTHCDLAGMVQLVHEKVKGTDGTWKVKGDGSRELVVGSHPALSVKSRFHSTVEYIPVEMGVNPIPDIMA